MAVALPNAYKGDSYSLSLIFPDASYLNGSPGDVLAQVRSNPTSDNADATFTCEVDGAVLTITLAEVTLPAGTYYMDVQVGATTYVKRSRLVVEQDVSR